MSVYKKSSGAHYRIDREFMLARGQRRRLAFSSYTTNKQDARDRERLAIYLAQNGHFEILEALQDKRLTVLDLLHARRLGRLNNDHLPQLLKLQRPLWATFRELIDASAGSEKNRTRYHTSLTKLERSGVLAPDAIVASLETVDWRALKATWKGSAADWNHLRRMVSHALTLLYGDRFAQGRRQVLKDIPWAKEARGSFSTLTPALFLAVLEEVPEYARPAYWCLAITAVRLGEYLRMTTAHLRPAQHQIDVPGTKTEGSADVIQVHPALWYHIEAGVPSPIAEKWMRTHFKRAVRKLGVPAAKLQNFRSLGLQLALSGGAGINDAQALARHETPDMTMRYLRTNATARAAEGVYRALVDADIAFSKADASVAAPSGARVAGDAP